MTDHALREEKMRRSMTNTHWVQPRHWRWKGIRRWHNWAVGPLCISFYVYPKGNRFARHLGGRVRSRVFVAHSWQYVHRDGDMRHSSTLRRWIRARRRCGL